MRNTMPLNLLGNKIFKLESNTGMKKKAFQADLITEVGAETKNMYLQITDFNLS